MIYRTLGRTNLRVSEIGMGCEGMVAKPSLAQALFDEAERLGVNFFDLYSPNPDTRAAIGRALKGRREKFIIQSHLCSCWTSGQYKRTRNLALVEAAFEDSLKLLNVERIDIGMIHYCDSRSDWNEIVSGGVLDYARALKRAGKIRFIGLSSHNPDVALEAVKSGEIETLMFSINPVYDLQPPSEDIDDLLYNNRYKSSYENSDPVRAELYETCQREGVGITVMKPFAGGDLLDAKLSQAKVALTVNQCIHYCLTRPAVVCVLPGVKSVEELRSACAYENASDAEKDYAEAMASFPIVTWKGHCVYCSHCGPCPERIDIATVTKFLNLAEAQGEMPETVREHYAALEHKAGDCIECGVCETRCPFGVEIRKNMQRAKLAFGA